ncbi:hypothetical protein U9M48_024681 [Paspalum notatum var. saurae]|uniref:Integrase catalytic domain-containing protein n=1 Tax=Paspalum notatum var. saurae TaxID=547442 RepID=A0AAQ3WXE4_PASNO
MPFGLTNAPSTFQALMNSVLGPFLRPCVLVFFDDILVYSKSWSSHMQHVRAVLTVQRDNVLVLKRSKCLFGEQRMHYLGYVITNDSIAMGNDKMEAVQAWPLPRSVKALCGFFGLTGYHRKFIFNYGIIEAPLTALLKKAFLWTDEATAAFNALKQSLTIGPVLQLPDFNRPFTVDCDASSTSFGVVLHQGGGSIAFFSKTVAPQHAKLAAYERHLALASLSMGTEHCSLKHHLDQRLTTIPQYTWVEYKPSKQNAVVDALSRREEANSGISALTEAGRQEIQDGIVGAACSIVDDLILHKRCVFVPSSSSLRSQLLDHAHGTSHEDVQKTLHRLHASCYNPHAGRLVKEFVQGCTVCQRNKTEHLHPTSLLQPLDVPKSVWCDIAMDFVEGFLKVVSKSVISTVVDCFSKMAHFLPLGHPYTALSVAKVLFDGVIKLHGLPCSIVSDQDPVFTSVVWNELFSLADVKLRLSSAFRAQTDGQSEVTNRVLGAYLRCLAGVSLAAD